LEATHVEQGIVTVPVAPKDFQSVVKESKKQSKCQNVSLKGKKALEHFKYFPGNQLNEKFFKEKNYFQCYVNLSFHHLSAFYVKRLNCTTVKLTVFPVIN